MGFSNNSDSSLRPGVASVAGRQNYTQSNTSQPTYPQTGSAMQRSLAPNPGLANPSMAPNPPIPGSVVSRWGAGASQFPGSQMGGTRSAYEPFGSGRKTKWLRNSVCIKATYDRARFNKGDVIPLPFHAPVMNENLAPTDDNLRQSKWGPVLSKRRMFIVLWKFKTHLFCVPLYSFGLRGFQAKANRPGFEDYITVMNEADDLKPEPFDNQGCQYEPLVFRHIPGGFALEPSTCCHITAGVQINWQEHIYDVGRIDKQSYLRLLRLYKAAAKNAEEENYAFPQ
ncbi:uncharacterized protein MYCFIDRAFT_76484 [Pseudocercospora fijiensis CIRAD86]|uniref:DUF6590 domain-containing protein n=1 Tax=Pseudocercospora fijiensis (strain CIRAD86) TaxID=383855 RepID=N1QAW4_PSEFD|nr:uncharacterized protein MYCFIDRAFT_76484 [Pseudocercospora fijiensis CIRAD86]EME89121.1 hypothetical protein MYCFIDRAFT_76484 [Pseudocercospora fijiensis CIRAD86]